jgi:mannose-1-phosphate guanylyltransferase
MKAFLLAAGEGTRLRPLTLDMPKCLVPIGGVPLLEIWYRHLERHGVREVLINTHHRPEQVEAFVRRLETPVRTTLTYEESLLGSAGTVLKNRDFAAGEEAFWIVYADSLTTLDLGEIMRFHRQKESILTLGLFHTDIPKESGIVTLDSEGRVSAFVEKSPDPPGDLSNTGVMAASPALFDEIPERPVCDLSYHVLPRLVGRMHGLVRSEFFIDIGTMDNYRKAQEAWPAIRPQFTGESR